MNNLSISTWKLAQICGVSQGTVDRALHDRGRIDPETKERILAAAKRYGYRHANAEKAEKKLVGVVVFNLNNEYFSTLITHLEDELRKQGFYTLVMFSNYDKSAEIRCIQKLYDLGVSGIILSPANCDEQFAEYLNSLGIPVVTVANQLKGIAYSGIDDKTAMYRLTHRFLGEENEAPRAYSEIVYFSPALRYEDAVAQQRRYQGFLQAVGDRAFTLVTDPDDLKPNYAGAILFCSTDYYAVSAYFKTKGAKIVGFDNISALASYRLPIDSLSYSLKAISQNAVTLLLQKGKGDLYTEYTVVSHSGQ